MWYLVHGLVPHNTDHAKDIVWTPCEICDLAVVWSSFNGPSIKMYEGEEGCVAPFILCLLKPSCLTQKVA